MFIQTTSTLNIRMLLAVPLAAVLFLALLASGCGSSSSDKPAPGPAKLVPQSALLYVDATVDPEGDLRDNFDSVSKKLTNGIDFGAKLTEFLDKSSNETDNSSFSKNIKPWLGQRVGFFLTKIGDSADSSEFGLLAESADNATAEAGLKQLVDGRGNSDSAKAKSASYKGTSYQLSEGTAAGVVGDFAVVADERSFREIVDLNAGTGESLADSKEYLGAIDELPDNQLLFAYSNLGSVSEALKPLIEGALSIGSHDSTGVSKNAGEQLKQMGLDPGTIAKSLSGITDNTQIAVGLDVQKDAVGVESIVSTTDNAPLSKYLTFGGSSGGVLDQLPANSWLATTIQNLGNNYNLGSNFSGRKFRAIQNEQFKRATGLDLQKDLLNWMGDTTVFVRGTSLPTLGGAIEIEVTDKGAATRALGRLVRLAGQSSQAAPKPTTIEGASGYELQVGAGATIDAVISNDKLIVGYGANVVAESLKPSDGLSGSEIFKSAKSALDGTDPVLFVDVSPILTLAENFGAANDPDFQSAKPYLQAISFIAAGTKVNGDKTMSEGRVVLGVK